MYRNKQINRKSIGIRVVLKKLVEKIMVKLLKKLKWAKNYEKKLNNAKCENSHIIPNLF
jgi:hypothetical protein